MVEVRVCGFCSLFGVWCRESVLDLLESMDSGLVSWRTVASDTLLSFAVVRRTVDSSTYGGATIVAGVVGVAGVAGVAGVLGDRCRPRENIFALK